jgi:glycerol dehydrogenase
MHFCSRAYHRSEHTISGIGFESGGLALPMPSRIPFLSERTEGKLSRRESGLWRFGTAGVGGGVGNFDAVQFLPAVELPLTFEALGAKDPSAEELERAGKLAVTENGSMGNMPFPVSWEQVVEGMKKADRMGEAYKKGVKNDTVH